MAAKGFRKIDNDTFYAIMAASLTGSEYKVILAIVNQTWGFGKTCEAIKLDTFEKLTGLTRQGIVSAIKKLKTKGIIATIFPRAKRGPKSTVTYALTEPSTWTVSQPQLPNSSPTVSQPQLPNSATTVDQVSQLPTPTGEPIKILLKETIKEKKTASFEEYKNQLRERFSDLDFDIELEKFNHYWSEGTRKLLRPKLSLLNWMLKARKIKAQESGRGAPGRRSRQLPPRDSYHLPRETEAEYRTRMALKGVTIEGEDTPKITTDADRRRGLAS